MTCSFFAASSFEREADVLMDILAPRHSSMLDRRRNQPSSATAISTASTADTDSESDKGKYIQKHSVTVSSYLKTNFLLAAPLKYHTGHFAVFPRHAKSFVFFFQIIIF